MNRISQKFKELKQKKKKAFIAFITAGDPSLKDTEQLVLGMEKAGVDIVELGLPFSDPLADGPTIQASSQRALARGVTLDKIFKTVQRIRLKSSVPIAFMTYYNLVYHFGEEKFIRQAKKSGVDGLIIPDLPPEEATELTRIARKKEMATVFFVAPTTRKDRMAKIVRASTGFIYYVSLTGVTGARKKMSGSIAAQIRSAKKMTSTPVCVGFGLSTPQQVKAAAKLADGVIVGSAIINKIHENAGKKDLIKKVSAFVRQLTHPLR